MMLVFHIHAHTIEQIDENEISKVVVKITIAFTDTKALDIFCLLFEQNKVWFESNCDISIFSDLTQVQ